jgi:hypothetical protein
MPFRFDKHRFEDAACSKREHGICVSAAAFLEPFDHSAALPDGA